MVTRATGKRSDRIKLAKEDPIDAWHDRMLALYDGLAGKALNYAV
ncbi:hypothetical protein [Myxosarcina sp. GI1]|nr:hypothetical protein [Myxosarcina sp. GI1]